MCIMGQPRASIHCGHSVTQPAETTTSRIFPVTVQRENKLWSFFDWQLNAWTGSDMLLQLTTHWPKLVICPHPFIGHKTVYSYYMSQMWRAGNEHALSIVCNCYNIYAMICSSSKRQKEIGNKI